jgi:acetoacetyl-CoA synthetase
MTESIWQPSLQRITSSNMQRFLERNAHQLSNKDYSGLYQWSIDDPAAFWAAAWEFFGIRSIAAYTSVVDDTGLMPGAKWFDGATLNFADNLLRPEYSGVAIVSYTESGRRTEMSWETLRNQVASVADALRAMGVERGDRIAGVLPNCPEAIVALLASASLGAIWSSCSPDFGVDAVIERFGQIKPKVLFAADGYYYNGKVIDTRAATATIVSRLEDLHALVVVSFLNESADLELFPDAKRFETIANNTAALQFEALPFDHPLYILYSSGTTGTPKCIVHGVGGSLIQHQKEHVLHCDVNPGDVLFYFTTCGWMMWNWLVSGLASGATLLLYDGAPLYPDPGSLWRIAEKEKVKVFGTSAKYLSALEKAGYHPRQHVALDSVQSLLSTGSPLAPSSFDFVYTSIKEDLQLSSVAGGTDIVACFGAGNPILPVYRGELQCRALGMNVDIFDQEGNAVRQQKGELVCTAAFPSMPIRFWNDPEDRKYEAAYFSRYPGVWCQGDYAELTKHKGLVIYGRSDAVLNPGGVRIGTAELYRVVERFEEVTESIVVAQEWQEDVRIVLFICLQSGHVLDDDLRIRLRDTIRTEASPRHVPAIILDVLEIPRTISGKIVEIAVRDVIHGRPVTNTDALANPLALDHFKNRVELTN